ncbi:MAG TPA: outer membrane beta-barrel protein [Elusimicrobiales bacterium]|nr:outer membrane beta-barrel protein [Elusimicrobiales bacterium]
MKNIIIGFVLLAAAQPALALQNIKIGGVDINPVVSVKQSYDSNIYLQKLQPKSANINRTAFGVNAAKQFGSKLDLKAGYMLELLTYSRAASINNAVHNNANVELNAKLPRNTALKFTDVFTHTSDQATSELTARAKRLQNNIGVSVDSPLRGNFGYGIDVQHIYNNYDSTTYDMLDRSEVLAGVSVNYKLQPKTKVFLGYTYGNLTYDKKNTTTNTRANNAVHNDIDLGITGNLGPKLVGTVKAGVQMRNYSKDLATAKNDATTAGYSGQLQWKPLEKTEVIYYGKRGNVETNFGNSRFYTSTLNDISASREVNKFKVGVGMSFETVQYPERSSATAAKRFDHNTNARLTVDYNIQKWLKAGAGYTYKNRSSNYSTNDYKDNVVGLEVKGMF